MTIEVYYITRKVILVIKKKPGSLKEKVYKTVMDMICNGELPADTIFTEKQLIEHCGVSKSPVRESLIQLCAEGTLRNIPRCGYQVINISAKNVSDLSELRLFLELSSLPKIFSVLNDNSLEKIIALNLQRQKTTDKDVWEAWNNNVQFHLLLNSFSGNTLVYDALERALNTCTRAYAQLYRVQESIIAPVFPIETFHDKVVSALSGRDLSRTTEYLKKDILFMEQQLLITKLAK